MSSTFSYQLGFLGAGNMAEAIARAAIDRAGIPAGQVIASDPNAERRAIFSGFGATAVESSAAVIAEAEAIVLAIKPQTLPQIAPLLAALREDQVVISIMAGIRSEKIQAAAGKPLRVVRVMPNTPVLVGKGMAGIALGEHARPGDEALALQLFQAAGEAVMVQEAQIDAITAISGSGPAYLFYLAEAMERAAEAMGLGEHARLLVAQTLQGSADLLAQSGEAPQDLRRKVTSPGGTTEAACRHLDQQQVAEHILAALQAAERRSCELGA